MADSKFAASQRNLLQIVDALRPPRRLARRLNRRQQQRDQNADDGNHDQQLDQRERARIFPILAPRPPLLVTIYVSMTSLRIVAAIRIKCLFLYFERLVYSPFQPHRIMHARD